MGDRLPLELREIHAILQAAVNTLETIRGRANHCSSDTAFAIGEALGILVRARALVGRDIDQFGPGPEEEG